MQQKTPHLIDVLHFKTSSFPLSHKKLLLPKVDKAGVNHTTQRESHSFSAKVSEMNSSYNRKWRHVGKALSAIKNQRFILTPKTLISEWFGVTHKFPPQMSEEVKRPGVRRPTTLSLLKACAAALIWISYRFQLYQVQMSLLRPKASPTKLWHESASLKQLPHHFGVDTKGLWIQK